MQENSQTTMNYQPDNRLRQAVATQNTRLVRVLLTSELNNEERSTEDLFNMLHYVSEHLPQTFAVDLEDKTDEILSEVTRCNKVAFRRQQIYLQDHFSRTRLEQLILIRSTLIENTHPFNRIEMEELHKVIEETAADDPDKQEELQALLDAIQQVSAYTDEYTTAAQESQQNSATIPLDTQTPQNKSPEQTADEMPVLSTINHDEDEHLPKASAEYSSKALLIVVVVIVIVIGVWLIQKQ